MAGVEATIEVAGIKEALATLRKIDPKLRRQITVDFRKIVDVVVNDAQSRVPLGPPLSGMENKWTTKSGYQIFPWGLVQDTVVAGVSGKKVREFAGFMQNLATFYIRFSGPSAVIIDMAGRGKVPTKRGTAMVQGLNEKFGRKASRILWPTYEAHQDQVEGNVQDLVDKVMQATQRELVK